MPILRMTVLCSLIVLGAAAAPALQRSAVPEAVPQAVPEMDISGFISLCRDRSTSSIAIGDVDGDGRLDVVFGIGRHRAEPNLLYISGYRTDLWFPPRLLGNSPSYRVELVDVNGDKHLDLVDVTDYGFNKVVWLNDGRGNFQAEAFFGRDENARGMAVGDLTGDGFPDVVLANRRGVRGEATNTFYVNDGTGQFRERRSLAGGGSFNNVSLADFDGDGDLDIVAAGISGSSHYLYLNDGAGRFEPGKAFGVSNRDSDGANLAVADLNADGRPDVVLVNHGEPGQIFFGDGKGSFAPSVAFTDRVQTESYAVAIGDMDGDGSPDVVVGYTGRTYDVQETGGRTFVLHRPREEPNRIFFNDGKGNLRPGPSFGQGMHTRAIRLGDVDGDGRLDIVMGSNCGENAVYLNRATTPAPRGPR